MFATRSFKILILFITLSISLLQAETLKIGTGSVYPPFIQKDAQGNLTGFEIEIGLAVCKEMKVECELIQLDSSNILPMLKEKKINFAMNVMNITEDRLKEADAGNIYIHDSASFLKLKSNNIEFVPNGLKGKKIGIRKGSPYHNYILNNYPNDFSIKEYDGSKLMVDGLLAGEVDFILGSKIYFEMNYVKLPNSAVAFFGPDIEDQKWFGSGMSAYFNKDDSQLRESFNNAIKTLRAHKDFQKISQKYFQKDIFR